ncbi:hypothetical protein KRX11_07485 [Pasteurellaceae bacterium TAE3-ERU1]|nr:hypothetical protein [Pasteurellaceae bacterium TAE3-ERU1]
MSRSNLALSEYLMDRGHCRFFASFLWTSKERKSPTAKNDSHDGVMKENKEKKNKTKWRSEERARGALSQNNEQQKNAL